MNLTDMYMFINEFNLEKYDGEPLKLYVGGRLIRIIANPTEEELRMFGYKNLIITEKPDEKEGYVIETYYEDGETSITQKYRYIEIPDEIEE